MSDGENSRFVSTAIDGDDGQVTGSHQQIVYEDQG